jgi:hypothetical protein
MNVLQATKDLRKVSLWLGHAHMETTEVYLRADPTEKLETIGFMTHPHLRRRHFRPVDKLIASLEGTPKNIQVENTKRGFTDTSRRRTPHTTPYAVVRI